LESDSDEAVSSDSESELDDDTVPAGDNINVSGSQDNIWLRPQHTCNSGGIHTFIGSLNGLRIQEAPHVNKHSNPVTVFFLFFTEVIQLLVAETNNYYSQYLDTLDNYDGCSRLPEVTVQEMYMFLAIIIQMGHGIRDTLKEYWSTLEQIYTPFYSNVMKRDRFFHILRFLHFCNNMNQPDKTDKCYDRLWKIRTLFDKLNDAYAEFYSPTEHLAVDVVVVLFKGRVVFKQYIPKKHKHCGIKIYKLCDMASYTCNMNIYLGSDRQNTAQTVRAKHAIVKTLTRRIEGLGHKLYMGSFFSSPDLFDDLHTRAINCCGTVRQNCKGMPEGFDSKTLKLKRGDIYTRVKGNLTATIWKDKGEVRILTNMHKPSVKGKFCDKHGKPQKPAIVEDYSQHMDYVKRGKRMTNNYSVSRRSWKWKKKLFFHLLDLTIVNSYVILSSCGSKIDHRKFRLTLVQNLLEMSGREPRPQSIPGGRPNPRASQVTRLESQHTEHWPAVGSRLRCRVCSSKKKRTTTRFSCMKCKVGLCIEPCFQIYHTKVNF
jgi:hypothetical protein